MPRNTANYNDTHLSRSQIFIFDYGRAEEESDDCESADDSNMYFSSRLRGQRISFDVVDSGWQRREDADSISTVLSWKFSLHDDGLVPEEHIIRWRILQKRQCMNEKCTVSSTVLCTKGIRPENNKKRSKDSSLFTIHSSTKRVSSGDSEILADFHWESKSQDSASSANFELIAYRQRSPMFRQFDLLINGTSFFELPEFEKKWHPSPPRSPGIIRRNGPKSKQSKVHPAASRRPSRSLSPTHSYSGGTKTFHRKVHSLAVESPICVFRNINSANISSDCSHKISMSYIDQLMIHSDFYTRDEKAIEADALHFTYLFASQMVHSQQLSSPRGCANRYDFIRKTLSEMINLVVLGKLNSDVASRIVHCAATMVGFPVMVPMSNIVLLLSIPEHENHCTLSTKLRCYGEIDNLVLASGNLRFGVCTFRSGTDAATAIRASCRGELNIKVRNLEFAFQNCELEGNYSSPLQHENEIKESNSLSETVKQSNKAIPKPNAKLPKTLRERTFTLEGYRDSALDAFRRGVENSVKDCECMLNRAITMALLDNNSAPGAYPYSPKIEQDANFLSAANEMRLASKTLPERATFLEDAVFQLASLVRRRTLKPEQAANIIHECASLLDLPLFRPLGRPCILLSGIKENCSIEELETCLKQYGEIDEIGIDNNRNGKSELKFV